MENKLFKFKHKHHNWEVPASVIALNRTEYYAKNDPFEKDSQQWKDEYEFSMEDDELEDWYWNNMDFEDIENEAVKLDRYLCEEDEK